MELPFGSKEPLLSEPRFMIVYSKPKIGKTSNLMALPNSLLIDLENSGEFFAGNSINLTKEAEKEGKHPVALIKELSLKIKEANKTAGKPVYDFIVLDSATVLEDHATLLATRNYRLSPIGKNFTGKDVVKELPNGAGYGWLRDAFEELYLPFVGLPGKCFILVVHTKDSVITKDGKELSVLELNLAGKSKLITASKADAIGLIYRAPKLPDTNILSFVVSESNTAIGTRMDTLKNKEFTLSSIVNDKLETNWDVVFPSLNK